jgi:hypothetical protein
VTSGKFSSGTSSKNSAISITERLKRPESPSSGRRTAIGSVSNPAVPITTST